MRKRMKKKAHKLPIAKARNLDKNSQGFWDNDKSTAKNYSQMGVIHDVNRHFNKYFSQENPNSTLEGKRKGTMTEKLLECKRTYEESHGSRPIKSMAVKEQERLIKLWKKHGDDYKAMARDIKINIKQLTAHKLEQRSKLLRELQAL